jgi:LysM repeat protein
MRATTLSLTIALALSSSAAFAQSSYNVVVEPTTHTIDAIINAPIEYDENGIVKAQHFNADNLTEEEYQAVLDEANRVRAYRDANGLNFESEYIYPSEASSTSSTIGFTSNYQEPAPLYQIDLFEPQTTTTTSSAKTHTVSKGDTLYNISKRYGATVSSIQAENGLSGTTLSIGQRIRIPGIIVESVNATAQPVYANTLAQNQYTTRRVVQPAPTTIAPRVETVGATEAVYAILPKDTLYSISRRSCVRVADIVSRNALVNPNDLKPGQRITLPIGHCLTR